MIIRSFSLRPVFATRLFHHVVLAAATVLATFTPPDAAAGDGRKPGARSEANAVVHWNTIAEEVFAPSQGTNPMAQSRTLAILHASIHDALNAIHPRYESYTPGLPAAPAAHPDAAVAAAAHEVLIRLLPDQAVRVEAAYIEALAAVPDGAAELAGVATGQAAARATIDRRQADGADSAAQPAYFPRFGPGEYQFTPPFDFAAQPRWGEVTPFVIDVSEHALVGPHALGSREYARDFAHIAVLGRIDSTIRTAEQTEIAKFWYEDSPLGWNRIANTVIRQRQLDAWDTARAFALLHFAMADGFIAGFDAKYAFRFWRPETAIRAADSDGNAQTNADSAWQPLLVTPPVPDYPSTHTVLGWAAAEVLIELFGDKPRYSMRSLTLPGVTRTYRGFSAAADENGQSRLYAGIHFRHAVRDGRRMGRGIGQAVAEALPPVPDHR